MGIETHRASVCKDTMNIIRLSFQHVSTSQMHTVPYLSIIFEILIAVIQYNGLPNQISPQTGANPVLGRLAAQAIVHVARTTPQPFKEVLGELEPHPRAILEFAFRSEMDGYAEVNIGPKKKKLNLKSY